jgi:uncharacterized protein Yka (UPF0111/DUF47 family)
MRSTWLGRLISDLAGRSDRRLIEIVAGQIDVAVDGAALARTMAAGGTSAASARTAMSAIEHRGDDERSRLVVALTATLTTPIDREDLFRLSRCVDDVLDGVRDFVRETHLYGLAGQSSVIPILDAVIDGLCALRSAVQELPQNGSEAGRATLTAKKSASRIRQCYQLELAELFKGSLDIEIMKRRELLRRLDVVGLRLGEAADALADGIVKRGR